MKTLPNHVQHYQTTPVFTQDTVPKGLLKDHNTKKGVWGLICVSGAKLEYIIEDKETHILTPENHGVVEPEILHHIRPLEPVTFSIQFYK